MVSSVRRAVAMARWGEGSGAAKWPVALSGCLRTAHLGGAGLIVGRRVGFIFSQDQASCFRTSATLSAKSISVAAKASQFSATSDRAIYPQPSQLVFQAHRQIDTEAKMNHGIHARKTSKSTDAGSCKMIIILNNMKKPTPPRTPTIQ